MSEFSQKLTDEVRSMSALVEASNLIRRVAEPSPAGDSTKAAMSRAWRRVNASARERGARLWSFNRVRDVWRPDPRVRIREDEMAVLRTAAKGTLRGFLLRGLETEFARLSHELQMVRQSGDHPAGEQAVEIEAMLAKIQGLLEEAAR